MAEGRGMRKDRKVIGRNIRYYRKRKGMTVTRLGMELGLSGESVNQIELGYSGFKMTPKRIFKFAQALDVSKEQLFDENNTCIMDTEYTDSVNYNRNIRRIRRQKDRNKKRLGRFI
jgi:transcriptional regulator with XRE-family HTH domain